MLRHKKYKQVYFQFYPSSGMGPFDFDSGHCSKGFYVAIYDRKMYKYLKLEEFRSIFDKVVKILETNDIQILIENEYKTGFYAIRK